MNKFKKILALSLGLSLVFGNISIAQTMNNTEQSPVILPAGNLSNLMQADIKSERVPTGTIFKLRMETPVNSYNTTLGDTFRATLLEDIRIGTKVIIPVGTIVRGRAGNVKKNSYLSRGGKLNLAFDHIVTPMGKQIPLNVKITNAKYLDNNSGVLSAGGGYLNAVSKNIEQGNNFLISATEYGFNKGKAFWNGYPVILTAPLGFGVGVAGGAGIFTVKSTVALFKKGDNVKVNPGDVIEIILKEPLDIPLN
jgi:hypothetical protein